MTVSSTVASVQYTGTGAEPDLSTVFSYFVDSDVVVTQRVTATGVDTTMVKGTHYTILGGSAAGAIGDVTPIDGSVDFTSAMTWSISRSIPLTQTLDYLENDIFPAASHEQGLDRLTMQSQDRDAVVNRSLRFPEADVSSLTSEIPNSVLRASKALTFDGSGNVTVTDPASASGTTVTATGSTTARTLQDRFAEVYNVKDFGAVGDGVTDDRTAIVNAINLADDTGRAVFFPEGRYVINSTDGAINATGVTLLGTAVKDGTNAGGPTIGSVIYIAGHSSNAAFGIGSGTTIDGLGFWYTNQPDSASPTAYEATLRGILGAGALNFVTIKNCVFFNSYIAIDMAVSRSIGHVIIDSNTIYGINTGIEINGNDEVIKITKNSFTPSHMTDATLAGLREYTITSGKAIRFIDRSDGCFIEGNQFYGYNRTISYELGQNVAQHIRGNEFGQTPTGIFVGSLSNLVQSVISSNIFFCKDSEDTTVIAKAIHFDTTVTLDKVLITGNWFALSTGAHIVYSGTAASRITVVGNHFEGMADSQSSGSYGAVDFTGATSTLMFVANYVEGGSDAYASGLLVTSATVVIARDNTFQACNEAVDIASAGHVLLSNNVSFSTVAATSDDIGTITQIHKQIGNSWDKPETTTVVAATDTDVPVLPLVVISGNTNITNIYGLNEAILPAGSVVTLKFTGTPTVSDGGGNLKLAGNLVATADDILVLVSDGTSMIEVSRSVN